MMGFGCTPKYPGIATLLPAVRTSVAGSLPMSSHARSIASSSGLTCSGLFAQSEFQQSANSAASRIMRGSLVPIKIGGPQATGFVAGRGDLIESIAL
jgi:hypothetical protein